MKTALPANRNVRQRLKNETSKIHKRLDDFLSTRGLFNSLENYRWYLCGMYALYRHCDSSIRWAQVQAGLETRAACLFELIELDLATFGVSAPAFESTNVDHDQATRWAQAYVMEGSAVGASFMIRGAKKKLGDDVGVHFLTQLSVDAKQRWPKFTSALSEVEIDGDLAVEAACEVFERAYEIFSLQPNADGLTADSLNPQV